MKNKIIFVLIGIILTFNLFSISSQEEISLLNGQIIGKGVEYQKIQEEGIRLAFTNAGAIVNIREDKFENIIQQDKAKHPTYLELDKD